MMAVLEDYEALKRLVKKHGNKPDSIIGCSLNDKQVAILSELSKNLRVLSREDWDLSEPGAYKADLIVACNVFHYAANPAIWLRNVLTSCKQFWMQDLFCRRRGSEELGGDGDQMRYGLGGCEVAGAPTFDLSSYRADLLDYWCYDAGSLRSERTCVNFVAVLKGVL